MLTCGLSCLNALNALFAKLVAVAIVNRGRREMEGGRGGGGSWAPLEGSDYYL